MSASEGYKAPGIAGSGAIACGLAASATALGKVILLARSDASAWRAEEKASGLAGKVEGGDASNLKVTTQAGDLSHCDLMVEAIAEDHDAKVGLLQDLGAACPDADLGTTTSSLSIAKVGEEAGHPGRVFGLHPFNPVTKMELIELCVTDGAREGLAERARAWCHALGKTVVSVPDQTGFVVNRLLFPFLFDAVRLHENTGMEAADVDRCMTLGAAHPMGPLALLDMVGLDVAEQIGDSLHEATGVSHYGPPEELRRMVAAGKLGRKSGKGFFGYEKK
ncbi:MAG: 3-hydroxyacyl-CoA dehydrogenase family protein [Solirubrobacterales bacterium]|nr:3-hydroxyacyl-CoA dehydrogenase family protein [Solirubrobacterales bacterium]